MSRHRRWRREATWQLDDEDERLLRAAINLMHVTGRGPGVPRLLPPGLVLPAVPEPSPEFRARVMKAPLS